MADISLNGVGRADAPGLFARIRNWLTARAEYRRTLNELRSLDQRTLDDLGLSAADLEAVARGRVIRR
jgi:uncharacterized protein YjiS (DUF1127 family)